MVFKKYLLLVLSFGAVSTALATEPCPPEPCRDEKGVFQKTACEKQADWIAVGRISAVKHRYEGPPLSKDFANFVFTAERWEQSKHENSEFYFKVGWCSNFQELPAETSGLFRFYISASPGPDGVGGPTHLYFERVN